MQIMAVYSRDQNKDWYVYKVLQRHSLRKELTPYISRCRAKAHLSLSLHEVLAHGLCLPFFLDIGPEVPLVKPL